MQADFANVVNGVFGVDGESVLNVVGAVMLSKRQKIPKCVTATTVSCFRFIYVDSATVNLNT